MSSLPEAHYVSNGLFSSVQLFSMTVPRCLPCLDGH